VSFDLFVFLPELASDFSQRFNLIAQRLGLSCVLDHEQCGVENRAVWPLFEGAEVWGELYLRLKADLDVELPETKNLKLSMHFPSHGDPEVFLVAAALAEAGNGLVGDPQMCAEDLRVEGFVGWNEALKAVGLYPPSVCIALAKEIQ
jgi:hypothetical protein